MKHRFDLIGKNEKVIATVKDELGEIILKEFVGLCSAMYLYPKDHDK